MEAQNGVYRERTSSRVTTCSREISVSLIWHKKSETGEETHPSMAGPVMAERS